MEVFIPKVSMKGVGNKMVKYLHDFKFGVSVLVAQRPYKRVSRGLSEHHIDGSLAMLIIDFSNVFNNMNSLLFHEAEMRCSSISLWVEFVKQARLYIGNEHIWFITGVQQGDPLEPLLFALVLHLVVY